jgi:hypothetical protein
MPEVVVTAAAPGTWPFPVRGVVAAAGDLAAAAAAVPTISTSS